MINCFSSVEVFLFLDSLVSRRQITVIRHDISLCSETEICFISRLTLGHKLLIPKRKKKGRSTTLFRRDKKREKCLISIDGSS